MAPASHVNDQLKRLDRAVYNVERTIVVTSLVVMAIVVFLDVVHRTFSGEGSKLAGALAKIAGMFGRPIPEDSDEFHRLVEISPYVSAVIAVALAYFGVRTSKRTEPVPPARALVLGVGGVVVVYGLIRLIVVLMPNGFIWSQPLALVLTLWVGFIGASMCTFENKHLRVEAVQRFLPERIKPTIGFLSGLVTAIVCLALLWVSLRYVMFNYDEYVDTEGKGGLIPSMDVPKYVGFLALPVAFGVMALRFVGKAFAALAGQIDDDPTQGLIAAKSVDSLLSDDDSDPRAPSEVETEAIPSTGPRQSEIDTVSSGDRLLPGDAPLPSQISTQPHPVDRLKGGTSPLPRRELQRPPQGARAGELVSPPRPGPTDTDATDVDRDAGGDATDVDRDAGGDATDVDRDAGGDATDVDRDAGGDATDVDRDAKRSREEGEP